MIIHVEGFTILFCQWKLIPFGSFPQGESQYNTSHCINLHCHFPSETSMYLHVSVLNELGVLPEDSLHET